MLIPGVIFMISMAVWYFLSGAYHQYIELGASFWIIIGVGALQLICFIGCRYYTSKLYDANLVKRLLEDSESDYESEQSKEDKVSEYTELRTEVDDDGEAIV